MKSVTKLFGFYRKGFIAVQRNRKDVGYFARKCSDRREHLHSGHSLGTFITDYESLIFGVQVKEIQVSEEEQNGDNKQSKYSSLHSE